MVTYIEVLLFARIIAYVFGDKSTKLGEKHKKIDIETLKRTVDYRTDIIKEQKYIF